MPHHLTHTRKLQCSALLWGACTGGRQAQGAQAGRAYSLPSAARSSPSAFGADVETTWEVAYLDTSPPSASTCFLIQSYVICTPKPCSLQYRQTCAHLCATTLHAVSPFHQFITLCHTCVCFLAQSSVIGTQERRGIGGRAAVRDVWALVLIATLQHGADGLRCVGRGASAAGGISWSFDRSSAKACLLGQG